MSRHCAFCLIEIPPEKVLHCGKCLKRAYCGKYCQKKDWTLKGGGQGHKNWCGLNCCEEDVDWSVVPIEGKGLGLIAKKIIPAKSRIIVEANCSENHPGVMDLLPKDGTYLEKLKLNSLRFQHTWLADFDRMISGLDNDWILCLRISRANHACDFNASHFYDSTFKVKVLFSEREIQIGEEICISYKTFKDNGSSLTSQDCRRQLKDFWGVICPEDCHCHDLEIETIARECKSLDSEIMELGSKGRANNALNKVRRLLNNQEQIRSSFISQARTLHDGFQVGIMKRKTIPVGLEFIKKAFDIESSIVHPESESAQKYKHYITNYQSHHNYLIHK